jgi:hypothetical protein
MYYYNVPAFNQALMGELATALEREAKAGAPADGTGARSTMPGGVPEACRATEGATGPVPPERIALSKFQFIYPAAALKNGRVGTTCIGTHATITVNYQILRAP